MRDPTADEVARFAREMQARFRFAIIDKRTDAGMRSLSHLLAPSIPPADFVSRFATATGETVYVPFIPGEQAEHWPLWSQVRIIVHEAEHVEQHRADPLFAARYLLSPPHRALYEAQALAAGWQIDRWRGVPHSPPEQQVAVLRAYTLDAESKAAALAALESSAITLDAGGRVSGVAAFAAAVLPIDLRK